MRKAALLLAVVLSADACSSVVSVWQPICFEGQTYDNWHALYCADADAVLREDWTFGVCAVERRLHSHNSTNTSTNISHVPGDGHHEDDDDDDDDDDDEPLPLEASFCSPSISERGGKGGTMSRSWAAPPPPLPVSAAPPTPSLLTPLVPLHSAPIDLDSAPLAPLAAPL